jgi:hypothetical protein
VNIEEFSSSSEDSDFSFDELDEQELDPRITAESMREYEFDPVTRSSNF